MAKYNYLNRMKKDCRQELPALSTQAILDKEEQ